jgi:hypothetical protein
MNAGFVLLAGAFLFGGDTDKPMTEPLPAPRGVHVGGDDGEQVPERSREEQRLQNFWNGYYDAVRKFYCNMDSLDWVAFYKNHGTQINNGSGRIQYAPIFPTPPVSVGNEPVSTKPQSFYGPLPAVPISAADTRPLGNWRRDVGDCQVTWRIENDRLFGTCRLNKDSSVVTLQLEADYSVTKDSVLFGVISSLDVAMQGNEEDDGDSKEAVKNARAALIKFIDQPFSIRYRVDDGVLTVKDVKIAGIGIRPADREDELLAVLVGKYTAAATVRASSQPLPEPKEKRKKADVTKAFMVLVSQVAPKSEIAVHQKGDTVELAGKVDKKEHIQAVVDLARTVWPAPAKVENALCLSAPIQQVQLDVVKVRIKRSEQRHIASVAAEGKLPAGTVNSISKLRECLNASGHKEGVLTTSLVTSTSSGEVYHVGFDTISMDLVCTVKDAKIRVDESVTSGQPRVRMLVKDGQTLVIGGQFRTTEKKIDPPAMIPILGDALRSICYDEIEEEVLFVITPRIMQPSTVPSLKGQIPPPECSPPLSPRKY